jgi:hypothetical protein
MSAEQQRAAVRRIAELAGEAINHQETVDNNLTFALSWLLAAKDKLILARTSAIHEMHKIDQMLETFRGILVGTTSVEALQAMAQFEMARERLHQYIGMLKYQIEKVEAMATVIQIGTSSEHFAEVKAAMTRGLEHLQEYNRGL